MSDKLSPPPLKPAKPANAGARRERAWGLAILNQFAFPGAGTVLAGRKIGYFQLALTLIGIVGLTTFLGFAIPHLGELLRARSQSADDPEVLLSVVQKWLPWTLVAFGSMTFIGISWLWALATSAKVLKSTSKKRNGILK